MIRPLFIFIEKRVIPIVALVSIWYGTDRIYQGLGWALVGGLIWIDLALDKRGTREAPK